MSKLLQSTLSLRSALLACCSLLFAVSGWAENKPSLIPNMFAPVSTPAQEEFTLSLFVIGITAGILLVVGGIWLYVIVKYRQRVESDIEPAQIYGSPQVELAWTIIPLIIVVVTFLTTARVIFAIQDNPKPPTALDVTVVGHQFWWEYRYPKYGVVVANEFHVPLSTKERPMPTFMKLQSADVWHSWWVPQLAGKVDNIPDHVNEMWIDPHVPGVYVGQCGQFCGVEHAKMLIRVYVDTPQDFQRWISNQQEPAVEPQGGATTQPDANGTGGHLVPAAFAGDGAAPVKPGPGQTQAGAEQVALGKQVFLNNACQNCHAIQGTAANGRFGPNLTHFGGRDTLASGAVPNTVDNLKTWIRNPDDVKEGALMPPMQLTETQLEQVSLYLTTLK